MKTVLILFCLACVLAPQPRDARQVFGTRQLIIVTAADWNASTGTLSFFEHDDTGWRFLLKDVPVTLGKKGMAWGKGLHPAEWNVGTQKREGDGKSPAGIFRITSLFGYGDFDSRMPYQKADSTLYCVDDAASVHYNRLVRSGEVTKDWESAETMRRKDHQYKWGAVVGYNTGPVIRGAGSCIFLHIWRSPGNGTAGCTALTEVNLLSLLRALDPAKNPTLIQMPEAELLKMRKRYLLICCLSGPWKSPPMLRWRWIGPQSPANDHPTRKKVR